MIDRRCLDIGRASWKGIPLAALTPTGPTHPAFASDESSPGGFARNFPAGLVYTCGLTSIGGAVAAPGSSGGEVDGPIPVHGRASSLPASHLHSSAKWENGEYVLRVGGVMREAAAFGTNLQLTRCITAKLGGTSFRVDDVVENLSASRASPLMFCYHCNPGFPVLDGTRSRLDFHSAHSFDRDEAQVPAQAHGEPSAYGRFRPPVSSPTP